MLFKDCQTNAFLLRMSSTLHLLKPAPLFAVSYIMRYFIILLISLNSMSIFAQESFETVDQQLEQVRFLALEQNEFAQAINLAKQGVVSFPESQAMSIFLCRLFFWSDKAGPALHYTDIHLTNFPQDKEASFLKIDILESQKNFKASREFITQIEDRFEGDQMLKYRKAYNLSVLGDYKTSSRLLQEIIELDPNFQKAKTLLEDIESQTSKQYVTAGYHLFRPVGDLVAMSQYELAYGKQINKSTFVGQLNLREIQGRRGLQGQLEWYRKINKHFYTRAHAAYSNSDLLARYRFGAGAYFEYDNGMQYSLTASRLIAENISLSIFSAGVNKRFNHLAILSKLYFVDDAQQTNNFSYLFGLRRYLNENEMYAGLNYGFVPQSNIQVLQQSESLHARFIGIEFSLPYKKQYELKLMYNLNLQKFALQRDQLMIQAKYLF